MRRATVWAMIALLFPVAAIAAEPDDPFLWLEEVEGERALSWVEAQNEASTAVLESQPTYDGLYDEMLAIIQSEDRIPIPALRGDTVYNFWIDGDHPRGIWRRAPLESYLSDEPAWQTVLDVDALAAADGVPWVFKGADCLEPESRRCLVSLSRGGADAVEIREFDTVEKRFVDDGFRLPEAKHRTGWRDDDTIWVATDFGEGTLSRAGYPTTVKLWSRGTPLADAETVFAGPTDDTGYGTVGYTLNLPEGDYDLVLRLPTTFEREYFLYLGDRLVKLDLPRDAELEGFFDDRMLVETKSGWTPGEESYPAGALLAIDLDRFLMGERDFEVLYRPDERSSLQGVGRTADRLLLSSLSEVQGQLETLELGDDGGWVRETVELPGPGAVSIGSTSDTDDRFFFSYQDFLTPSTLFFADGDDLRAAKSMPSMFDAEGARVEQYHATADDGTEIPYFVVLPQGFEADGTAPTLLYGYGGFESARLPRYSATIGAGWIERGGVYVVANIRGGGEFGPSWHKAAQRSKRMVSFQDFITVAEDLIEREVTSPDHLGIYGGSQGGLLVGGSFTMRPELFGAVVSAVPLSDMRRYHRLLAGSSWMGEYGDPDDPEEWAFIRTWSPYHLLREDADYPTPLYWTNTRDDRVHPAHARKMVAKMQALGHPVYYFENTEGGHGSGSTPEQQARIYALQYAYLWNELGDDEVASD